MFTTWQKHTDRPAAVRGVVGHCRAAWILKDRVDLKHTERDTQPDPI